MNEEEFIICPACGSSVAVICDDIRFGTIAHCKYDCDYKWVQLIEPDPDEFLEKGVEASIIPFEEDLDEIYYEDKDRYHRILKYSDFNDTLIDRCLTFDKDVPANLVSKRLKFFEKQGQQKMREENDYLSSIIDNFLNNNVKNDNIFYVLINHCEMEQISDKIIFDRYSKASLLSLIKETRIEDLKNHLKKIYNIDFIFVETVECRKIEKSYEQEIINDFIETNKVENLSIIQERFLKDEINSKEFNHSSFEGVFFNKKTSYNKTISELLSIIKNDKPIASLITSPPYIISKEDFYSDIKNNINIPSLIDFDNNIVFMNVSHKDIIFTLKNLIIEKKEDFTFNVERPDHLSIKEFINLKSSPSYEEYQNFLTYTIEDNISFEEYCKNENKIKNEYLNELEEKYNFDRNWDATEIKKWSDNIFDYDNMVSWHEAKEYYNLTGTEAETFFHLEMNILQVFTSIVNPDTPKILTYRLRTTDIKEFEELLSLNNIKFTTNTALENKDFITLNGQGTFKGEIYYPKQDEENIPTGKILVIPTASEEYFLPAISQMNQQGCIITEKGSKTSHLIINSKEFDFNIILVKEASKLFKNGDIIAIDFDNEKFII